MLRLGPTLTAQSLLFMTGSALFAVGTAVGALLGDIAQGAAHAANILCFIGAWFFTSAGLIQLRLSRPVRDVSGALRAEWLAAVFQSVGTVLFNVSTTAALAATALRPVREFVWSPDAGGSILFLVSAALVFLAFPRGRRVWRPERIEWWSAQINLLGCVAFGVSAAGAFVLRSGSDASLAVANWGTFVGAICFFLASLVVLPRFATLVPARQAP